MKKQYSLKELVALTKDINWVSQSYPDGVKLGTMSTVHLTNCIDYIKRRLETVGNIYSRKQQPFTYQQWLYLMCLQLLHKAPEQAVKYNYTKLHKEVNTIVFNYNLDSKGKTLPTIVKIQDSNGHQKTLTAATEVVPTTIPEVETPKEVTTTTTTMNTIRTKKGYIGTRVNGETAGEIRLLARKLNKTIEELGTEAMLDILNKYSNGQVNPASADDNSVKVYLYSTLNEGAKRYLTVNEHGISFVNTIHKASLFTKAEAETVALILGRVYNHGFETEFPNYCIRKGSNYLTRQEGWVSWTLSAAEADQFSTTQQAEEVINALKIIFNDDDSIYSVIHAADALSWTQR